MTSPIRAGPAEAAGRNDTAYEPGEPSPKARWREALAIIAHPRHLRRTICIALAVGTVLFAINQLDIVLRGEATPSLWLKVALTYLVPFCSSNLGVLAALREPGDERRKPFPSA